MTHIYCRLLYYYYSVEYIHVYNDLEQFTTMHCFWSQVAVMKPSGHLYPVSKKIIEVTR